MTRAPKTHSLLSGRGASAITGTIYDAPVMAAATRPLKDRWGFGAYVFAAVKQALTAAPVEFTIIADGKEIRVRAVSVMLANKIGRASCRERAEKKEGAVAVKTE